MKSYGQFCPVAKAAELFCVRWTKTPDQNVDLFLEATLPDMIYVRRGDLSLAQALGSRRLHTHGTSMAQRALSRWLGISPLAHVQSARTDAQRLPTR